MFPQHSAEALHDGHRGSRVFAVGDSPFLPIPEDNGEFVAPVSCSQVLAADAAFDEHSGLA